MPVQTLFGTVDELRNSAVVVIPAWNCDKWIGKCLDSVLEQTYGDIGLVFIDDCSTDRTCAFAADKLKGRSNVCAVGNKTRVTALPNIERAVREMCGNENSVIFNVDGDDWLCCPTAIEEMMKLHCTYDVVWSSHHMQNGDKLGWSSSRPGREDLPIRRQSLFASHLRSFKKFLFDAIDRNDMKDENGFYQATCDQAIMMPMLEMVPPGKRFFYDKVLYVYNHENPCNDDKVNWVKQMLAHLRIVASKPYGILPRYKQSTTVG